MHAFINYREYTLHTIHTNEIYFQLPIMCVHEVVIVKLSIAYTYIRTYVCTLKVLCGIVFSTVCSVKSGVRSPLRRWQQPVHTTDRTRARKDASLKVSSLKSRLVQ